MAYAKGKFSRSISDRSGQAFPYSEMVKEWNGSLVHISEFESKHPQLDPKAHKADPVAIRNARQSKSAPTTVFLDPQYWDGQFTSNGMQPSLEPLEENKKRQANTILGNVTVSIT
jgi:hypothetical protein|tara:strand:- start:2478 stop:2822 length:345 start_codon:yes stop_codon:yes gene_type:complete